MWIFLHASACFNLWRSYRHILDDESVGAAAAAAAAAAVSCSGSNTRRQQRTTGTTSLLCIRSRFGQRSIGIANDRYIKELRSTVKSKLKIALRTAVWSAELELCITGVRHQTVVLFLALLGEIPVDDVEGFLINFLVVVSLQILDLVQSVAFFDGESVLVDVGVHCIVRSLTEDVLETHKRHLEEKSRDLQLADHSPLVSVMSTFRSVLQ